MDNSVACETMEFRQLTTPESWLYRLTHIIVETQRVQKSVKLTFSEVRWVEVAGKTRYATENYRGLFQKWGGLGQFLSLVPEKSYGGFL